MAKQNGCMTPKHLYRNLPRSIEIWSIFEFYEHDRYTLFVIPLKKVLCFWPKWISLSVCVCFCLSVITFVARWLHSATWCQVRSILSISTRNCKTCQDDPFPDPDGSTGLYHILAYNCKTYGRIHTKFYLSVVQLGVHHMCCGFWDP